jgi:hypothetical protein
MGVMIMLYKKEVTIITQPQSTNDVKLEVIYNYKTHEYKSILKIMSDGTYKEYEIFYFKVPYEDKFGFANLREIFKDKQFDYSMYVPDDHKDINLMDIIIHLFETIQSEITNNITSSLSVNEENVVKI